MKTRSLSWHQKTYQSTAHATGWKCMYQRIRQFVTIATFSKWTHSTLSSSLRLSDTKQVAPIYSSIRLRGGIQTFLEPYLAHTQKTTHVN